VNVTGSNHFRYPTEHTRMTSHASSYARRDDIYFACIWECSELREEIVHVT
jgi:hypothetical protein